MRGKCHAGWFLILTIFAVNTFSFGFVPAARAAEANQAEADPRQEIKLIDRALLLELIKLSRFNIQFHQEANRHEYWRTLEYAAGRETGTAVSFAGSLMDLKQRVRGLDDPAHISRNALKNIVITSLVGSAISGSSSGIQLTRNLHVMAVACRKGYSPTASVGYVKEIVANTNALFERRERLAAAAPNESIRTVLEHEDLLLRRIRQQLLFEFRNWSCHSRGQAWRENTFYGIDAFQNYTRMGAAITGLRGFSDPRLGGGASITTVVANTLATINPIVCGLVGRAIGKHQFNKLTREFPADRTVTAKDGTLAEIELDDLQKDLKEHVPVETDTDVLNKAIYLSDRSHRLDRALDRENGDIERLRRVAQQQTIAGPLIGLTSMPGAILGTLAFYDYRQDRVTTNKLLFAGRISAITGQAFALVQTPATIVVGKIRSNRLTKKGELPSQLLNDRLKNLDALEERIKAVH
ncbi:MAG: hypothetical protein JSS83_05345 [Cyanobacteria bacterium SZAS LIN-3]|nr:hypothetical protein [Cyanobacteria bacterium SZAS LIN-3]